jgi:ribonuclease J
MKISFYGGVNEIGGNKFLLAYRNTQVFLDFGKSFERENKYFDFPLLQPFYISDLRKIQAIPNLKGLYKDNPRTPEVDGVLVTHPHVDHFGYISLLNGQVPVYLGEGAKAIIDIRSECYRAGWDRRLNHLSFETFRTGRGGEVGDWGIRPWFTPGTYDSTALREDSPNASSGR